MTSDKRREVAERLREYDVAFIAANGMQAAYINSGESTEEKR